MLRHVLRRALAPRRSARRVKTVNHRAAVLRARVDVGVHVVQVTAGQPARPPRWCPSTPGCPASACSTLVSRRACERRAGQADARRRDRAAVHLERRRDADDGVVRRALVQLGVGRGCGPARTAPTAMISSAARSTVNRSWKKSAAFTSRRPFGPIELESPRRAPASPPGSRPTDRRARGCRRSCRGCAPAGRRSSPRRPASTGHCCSSSGGRRDLVMRRRGADRDRAARLADAAQLRDPRDVDEHAAAR